MIKKISLHDLVNHEKLQAILFENNHGQSEGQMYNYLKTCLLYIDKTDFVCDIFVYAKNVTCLSKITRSNFIGWSICQNLLYSYPNHIEHDIYINPQKRGKGYGSKLFNYILDNTTYNFSCWTDGNDDNKFFYCKFKNHPKVNIFDCYRFGKEQKRVPFIFS